MKKERLGCGLGRLCLVNAPNFRFMLTVHTGKISQARYAFCPMDEVESISLGLWFKVGSRYENSVLQGGAHFIEHLMFKGTPKRKALAISQEIESKGGDLNAFTSEEMTCYYARMDADHLDLVLDVLFDMLWNSSFLKSEVERERGVILEEIRMYEDQPASLAMDQLNELIWKGNVLGLPVAGTQKSVDSMKRTDLINFWNRFYHPKTLTISLAGRFHEHEVKNKLTSYLNQRAVPSRISNFKKMELSASSRIVALSNIKPLQQSSLALGIRSYARQDPKCYAEKLLSVLLGENMSSRLFQSLREEHGLAYTVQTSINHFHDCGVFYLQLGVDPSNISAALKLVGAEFKRIKKTRPSTSELQRSKDYVIGQMKLGMESTSNRMMWMGESMVGLGSVEDLKEVMAKIQAVTPEQINLVARELFQQGRMVLTCVGPEMKQREIEKAAEYLK